MIMSGTTSVKPAAEQSRQTSWSQTFTTARNSITMPSATGIRADHLTALKTHATQGRSVLGDAAKLAKSGAKAARDLGATDAKGGEKIQAT
ncbi:hypothetical protein KIH27_03375 [Mycobacterium sp. M1]|uniref:Uncharacterized protein n=1 Tax=Mycolicibacter acidiphilus TaxID=2835306 RepID=A0ABS5RI52_9MYCO|nr:hypothetical protein [Mycolicibacter acidiphilus]MBS9532624.1 hypothetical protein [Mycolicibacter acidiphilus]